MVAKAEKVTAAECEAMSDIWFARALERENRGGNRGLATQALNKAVELAQKAQDLRDGRVSPP